mmetsp:Transcript_22097/g.71310  ORF Transcript_22097/g.71310 Transcript_22097/m.71310 type:complete len:214 (-) Transcript_22097:754-1395(-)
MPFERRCKARPKHDTARPIDDRPPKRRKTGRHHAARPPQPPTTDQRRGHTTDGWTGVAVRAAALQAARVAGCAQACARVHRSSLVRLPWHSLLRRPRGHPFDCGGLVLGGEDGVAPGPNPGQKLINVHLELGLFQHPLHRDSCGGGQDVVEGPIQPQASGRVERKPADHEREQAQGQCSRLGLLAVVERLKRPEQLQRDGLGDDQNQRNGQVA